MKCQQRPVFIKSKEHLITGIVIHLSHSSALYNIYSGKNAYFTSFGDDNCGLLGYEIVLLITVCTNKTSDLLNMHLIHDGDVLM